MTAEPVFVSRTAQPPEVSAFLVGIISTLWSVVEICAAIGGAALIAIGICMLLLAAGALR